MDKIKITVVGSGYVGMSMAVLLGQHNEVIILDVDSARVDTVNNKKSTVADPEIEKFLAEKEISLTATLDKQVAFKKASFVVWQLQLIMILKLKGLIPARWIVLLKML